MPKTVFKHVKGAVPPELLKKLEENPDEEYEVILLPMRETGENEDMPPETKISDALIESVKRSEKDFKEGRCTKLGNADEMKAHLRKLWNE